jgi:hypothetical protein
VCAAGVKHCQAGAIKCVQTTASSAEKCDGLDNDCDGLADEGDPGGGATCSTGRSGVCAAGVKHCATGTIKCVQTTASSAEVCDGKDNDCDGNVDDGDPQGGAACNTGKPGVCAAGVKHCQAGAIKCVQTTASSAEKCDGLDNDCDGHVDDGNPGSGASCNTGKPGACAAGKKQCQGGDIVCKQNVAASTEVCDGIDNDCDGNVDDGNPGGGAACTIAGCAIAKMHCTGGEVKCACDCHVTPKATACLNKCGQTVSNGCGGHWVCPDCEPDDPHQGGSCGCPCCTGPNKNTCMICP